MKTGKKTYIVLGLLFLLGALLYNYYKSRHSNEPFKTNTSIDDNYKKRIIPTQESCIQCHKIKKTFSPFHDPQMIGCTSCHKGDAKSISKDSAHKSMIKIPGNLSDAAQTCGKCHPHQLNNIQHSLMTTNSGIVAIDKYVWGDAKSPNLPYHIKNLKNDASDSHLRQLCANCHLGADKTQYGPITELSRGGGCNACHLQYTDEAKVDLIKYKNGDIQIPTIHPSTTLQITDTHCYGCHSRSSRISTNYKGLHETLKEDINWDDESSYTIAQDDRLYTYKQPDVHHSKGLLCIDCHNAQEVMGDGNDYLHEEHAVKLQCSDCHFKVKPNTTKYEDIDAESKLVFMIRNYLHHDKPFITTSKDNLVLVNTYLDEDGKAWLISKKDSTIHPIVPQSDFCSRDNAHSALSCSACHTSWAPRCIACHSEYEKDEDGYDLLDKKEVKGKWIEYVDKFLSGPPTLGVKYNIDSIKHINTRQILPAVPGMVMTVDHGSFDHKNNREKQFHRLFAPNAPHTIQKHARDCKSCHNNSIAIGYGEGSLVYDSHKQSNNTKYGKWTFESSYEKLVEDSLPQDAWIGFLQKINNHKIYSTRTNFRPFNKAEQQKILTVGSCLECHQQDSKVMLNSLEKGILETMKNMSSNCLKPIFN